MPRVETLEDRRLLTAAPEIRLHDMTAMSDLTSGSNIVNLGTLPIGSNHSRSFTIHNEGDADLTLHPASLSLPAGFSVSVPFSSVVAPSSSTMFTVQVTGTTPGLASGSVSFTNDDADESPFSFQLQATLVASPEIDVLDPMGTSLSNCIGSIDFGNTITGTPVTRSFTIQNTGTGDLSLISLSVPSGFTLTTTLPSVLSPGGAVSVTLQFDATAVGGYNITAVLESDGKLRRIDEGSVLYDTCCGLSKYCRSITCTCWHTQGTGSE